MSVGDAPLSSALPESQLRLDEPWDGTIFDQPIPLDVETVERALLTYLRLYAASVGGPLKSVAIDHFPDNPEVYRLTHQVGAVLVILESVDPDRETTIDEMRQEVELTWNFAVCVRSIGWALGGQSTGRDPGAYQVIDSLRLALSGLRLPGYTPMLWRRTHFVKRDSEGGVWYYQSAFAHRTTVVNVAQPENFPLLQKIMYGELVVE